MEPSAHPEAPRRAIAAISCAVLLAIGIVLWPGRGHGTEPPAGLIPSLNAALNATSALLLVAGWRFIRSGQVTAHRACMLSAFGFSALFLVGYLGHHARAGSVPFTGTGAIRILYFALLVPHIVLSAVVLPLALTTIWYAWQGHLASHRRIARWTLPLWLYVSVSGVAVYWMLYRL